MSKDTRVVVTGVGCVTPIGHDPASFWDSLMAGKSGAAPITKFDSSPFDTHFACEVKDYDPLTYIDRKRARRMDTFSLFALTAGHQAVIDAGIDKADPSEKDLIGVTMGSGIGGIKTFQDQTRNYMENGTRHLSPFFIPMIIADIAGGMIAMDFGFRGPNYSAVSACATGNNNIGDAFMLIKQGYCNAMVCGGSEASVCELGIGGFNAMRALSTRNDDPATASRPFDKDRDGFVLGEGAGAIILENLDNARKRGARIYAEVVGLGFSADAHHITAPDPEGGGAALAMSMMLRDAGLQPEQVGYLNMHGTSTPLGDEAETKAVKRVFGDAAKSMNLSSTKSMTGHALGAAGAIEAIATIFAVRENRIPPTINFSTADDSCDLNYTFNEPVDRELHHAASNSFGFGGHNTSIVFSKYTED